MIEEQSSENLLRFLKSDDSGLVIMGLAMAKGLLLQNDEPVEVSDEILEEILGIYIFNNDKKIRMTAKSIILKCGQAFQVTLGKFVKGNLQPKNRYTSPHLWQKMNKPIPYPQRLLKFETRLRTVDLTIWDFLKKLVWHKTIGSGVRSLMQTTPFHWKNVCLEILKNDDLFQGLDGKVKDAYSKELKGLISELESGEIPLTHKILSEGPVYKFMAKLEKSKDEQPTPKSENLLKFLESDDPGMYRMGLSMTKGAGLPEDLLSLLLISFFETNLDEEIRSDIYSILENDAPTVIRPLIASYFAPNRYGKRARHKESTFGKWSDANWYFWINSPKRGRLQEDTLGVIVGLKYWHPDESVRKVATHTLEAEAPELIDKLNLLNNPTKRRIYEVLSDDALLGCLSFIEKIRISRGRNYKTLFSKLLNLSRYDFYQVTQGNKYITSQNIGPLLEAPPIVRWIVACALTEASLYTKLTIGNIMQNPILIFWEGMADYPHQLRKTDLDILVQVIKSSPVPIKVVLSKGIYNFAMGAFKDKDASDTLKKNRKMLITIFEDPDLAKDILGKMS